jgi:GH18 family chitinase
MRRAEFGAVVAGVSLAAVALGGCAGDKEQLQPPAGADIVDAHRQNQGELNMYVQTWDSDATCSRMMEELPAELPTRITIAFADFHLVGTVTAPKMSEECARMVRTLGANATISMAVGGAGSNEEGFSHQDILDATSMALNAPETFARSSVQAMRDLSEEIGAPVTGVAVDLEDLGTLAQQIPARNVGTEYNKLLGSLRRNLPHARITADVPAGGFNFMIADDKLDAVEVMTYDNGGPWSHETADIAAESWVMDCVKTWSREVPRKKLIVGYPAYGYSYPGATGRGQKFTPSKVETPRLRDIPAETVQKTPVSADGNSAVVEGAWTSYVSPQQMKHTQQRIIHEVGKVGGAMVWNAEGATPDVYDALQPGN